METVEELEQMTRQELRAFLMRHHILLSTVQPSPESGKRYVRREQYLEAAKSVRANYYAQKDSLSPVSPTGSAGRSTPSNPFQRDSPRGDSASKPEGRRVSDLGGKKETEAAREKKKKKHRRRSSVGWIAPEVLARFNDNEGLDPEFASKGKTREDEGKRDYEYVDSESGSSEKVPLTARLSEGGVSDPDSTVSTDGESPDVSRFAKMKVSELRKWLTANGVRYDRKARKAELISIAKAHKTFLQAREGDDGKLPSSASPRTPTRGPSASKTPSGKRFSAPDIQEIEVQKEIETPARRYVRRRSQKGRKVSSEVASQPEAKVQAPQKDADVQRERDVKQAKTAARARMFPLFPKISMRTVAYALAIALLLLLVFWVIIVWRASFLPFCPPGSTKDTLDDGRLCRPCPDTFGTCIDGELVCDAGYRRVRSRCVQDHMVSDYAIYLARRASSILAEVAGRAECEGDGSGSLSAADLEKILQPDSESVPGRGRRWRRDYDPSKFETAFGLALSLLREDDNIEKSGLDLDIFRSSSPVYPLSCIVRRFVLNNLRGLVVTSAIVLIVGALLKRRRDRIKFRRDVDAAVADALTLLIDQRRSSVSDPSNSTPPYLIDTHLREEVLGRVTKEKLRIWAAVENELKFDTRVARTKGRMVYNQPVNTWEWRGRLRSSSLSSLTGSTPGGYVSTPGGYSSTPGGFDDIGTPQDRTSGNGVRRKLYPSPSY